MGFSFYGPTLGVLGCFVGPASLLGPSEWACKWRLFFKPHQLLPPALVYELRGQGAVIVPASDCYFHVSVRINPDRRHKSSVNNDPLGFAPCLFFDDLFSFMFL